MFPAPPKVTRTDPLYTAFKTLLEVFSICFVRQNTLLKRIPSVDIMRVGAGFPLCGRIGLLHRGVKCRNHFAPCLKLYLSRCMSVPLCKATCPEGPAVELFVFYHRKWTIARGLERKFVYCMRQALPGKFCAVEPFPLSPFPFRDGGTMIVRLPVLPQDRDYLSS